MGRLGIALFGPMLVTRDSHPVTGFEYDKVRALLAFLALGPLLLDIGARYSIVEFGEDPAR